MTHEEYARLKDIVAGALARPDAERAAYVSARCGPDATIRVEAESLLAAAVRAASLYEDPTLLIAGSRVSTSRRYTSGSLPWRWQEPMIE